jgi:UDP-N-acetylglucosamine 2-epimerase
LRELRVVQVVGTRPQLVKAAALSRALEMMATTDPMLKIEAVIIDTGQHYDYQMSKIFFEDLEIPSPDHSLGVGSGTHAVQTGEMMMRLEPLLANWADGVVLVAGDTNSTLAAGLCAAKLGLALAHVEAGLRSYNRSMPEEVNRVVVDHLSDLLFCPSQNAAENLAREGITEGVDVTGDVMLDTLEWARPDPAFVTEVLGRHGLEPGGFAIATVHRAENTDVPDRLRGIMKALAEVSREIPVLLPAHPRTAPALGGLDLPDGITLIEPVGHREMLALAGSARLGLTDSGGLQKELYWMGVPCVTMRTETEWVETVEVGWNVVAGHDPAAIVSAALRLANNTPLDRPPFYGDGHASERIVRVLIDKYASSRGG